VKHLESGLKARESSDWEEFTQSPEDRRLHSHLCAYCRRNILRYIEMGRFDDVLEGQCYALPLQ